MTDQTFTFGDGLRLKIPKPDTTLRVDMWAHFADGVYRFLLDLPRLRELEEKSSYLDARGNRLPIGALAIYGSVAAGRYEIDGVSVGLTAAGKASPQQCREIVRLALIGGGMAIVGGEDVTVDANLAKRLVANYLEPAPAEQSWNLAFAIMDTLMNGRKASPEELEAGRAVAVVPALNAPGAPRKTRRKKATAK